MVGAVKVPEMFPVVWLKGTFATLSAPGSTMRWTVTKLQPTQPVPENVMVSPGITVVGDTVSVWGSAPDASTPAPNRVTLATTTTETSLDSP